MLRPQLVPAAAPASMAASTAMDSRMRKAEGVNERRTSKADSPRREGVELVTPALAMAARPATWSPSG
eukprot:11824432-Alexandrium_andersonii.AAC.1